MLYYIIQECYNDGTIHAEELRSFASDAAAIEWAQTVANMPTFEASYVRVLTLDCESIYNTIKDW